MKIYRLILIMAVLLSGIHMSAADEKYSRLKGEVSATSPLLLPADLVKTDFNGDTLSVVIVKSPVAGLVFDGNIFGTPQTKASPYGTTDYYVYLTQGSRRLTVRNDKFHQETIEFPTPVGSNELWEISVTGIEAPKAEIAEIDEQDYMLRVNINTHKFSDLYIDEEKVPNRKGTFHVEEGTHYLSARYYDQRYDKKINVKNGDMTVDLKLGGKIILKNASNVSVSTIDKSPEPELIYSKGSEYIYDEMLGPYYISGRPNSVSVAHVFKRINVSPRSTTVFRIDEMVPYAFVLYHATLAQPLGVNVAYGKNFGFFASFSCDMKDKAETEYGETKFYGEDQGGNRVEEFKNTSMTFSVGPMVRLYRKLYLQAGVGLAYYLRTSQPKILTADYKYKMGLSVNAELLYRFKAFVVGAGYMHQSVKSPFNPDISDQFTASIGMAFGM